MPSNPALRMAATSSMRMPCTRSMVSTRSLVKSQNTCGTRMFLPSGEACRCDTQASIDCASQPEVQLLGQVVGEVGDDILR